MDSTTPDPQPQQPHQQHQQQQPQQPPQQHQPKPQPPPPQPQHQPHPHQPPPSQAPAYHQQPMAPSYHPNAGYYRYPQQYSYAPHHAPPFAYAYPQAPWPQAPNYQPAPPQPISTTHMVTPHSNVPQPHNKPTQIINPVINADNRPHNQTLQPVPNRAPTVAKPREKKPAILKDPTTKEEVPLPNATTSSTISSPSISKSSSNASSNASAPVPAITSTPASMEQHVHTLLQKVSEDGVERLPATNNGQDSTSKEPVTTTNKSANATTKTTATAMPATTTITQKDANIQKEASKALETAVKATDVIKTPAEVLEVKKTTVQAKEAPKATEGIEKPTEVPKDKETKNEAKEAIAKTTKATEVIKTPAEVSEDKETTVEVKEVIATPTKATEGIEKSAEVPEDIETTVEAKEAIKTTAAEPNALDTQNSSPKTKASIPETEEINGNEGGDADSNEDQLSESGAAALHYDHGQYNPVSNREGNKIYSRQFLLDVCEKICKFNLWQKERDDKIGMEGSGLPSAFSEKLDMFVPHYQGQRYPLTNRQNEPARRQSQHNYAGRGSAGQERQRKIITSVSLTQEVELKTASNPWRPGKQVKEEAPNDVVETESLKKKFRSILNKLTPNNFENLATAVTDLHIDTESKLGEVIDIVFAKALAEPGYCILYGQMCSHLKKITAGTANFGNTLLKRCQNQFQSDIYSGLNLDERKEKIEAEEDAEVKKQLNEELYEDMYRSRMRGLGLIKFIGELYKIEMLNDFIMFSCVNRLMTDTSEESLECLCDLLTTIGEKLDKSSQKNADKKDKAPKNNPARANAYQGGQKSAAAVVASGSSGSQQKLVEQTTSLNPVFEQIHKIRKNKDLPLSVRIRFKLLDVCELREKYNWQSKKTKDNNPKKLEEIRDAHREKLEQERQQNAMGPRRSQEGRRGLGHASGSSSQISSLANESSGNRGAANMNTSSSSVWLSDKARILTNLTQLQKPQEAAARPPFKAVHNQP